MNCEQFEQEVRESDICPADFDKVYFEFQKFQKLAMNTLLALHDVCEKNNVRYQLGFGSLLGAIRDDGQIPWDYDVDVIIPYEERFKLIEALDKDLSNEFYYYCPERNDGCRHYFMRISPIGFRSDRLHVDVFYVIGAPENQDERYKLESDMNKYFQLRYIKLVKINELAENDYKYKIKTLLLKIKHRNQSLQRINQELSALCERYDPQKTGITIPVLGKYHHIYWKTDDLWDTKLITNSAGTFRIPKNYDDVLTEIYKDYTRIYPLDLRLQEMYKSYYLLAKNRKIKNSVGTYYAKN